MESLLSTTPTNRLKVDFDKYLSSVLSESSSQTKPSVNKAPQKTVISESKTVEKTGNRTANDASSDEDFDQELQDLMKRAGIC